MPKIYELLGYPVSDTGACVQESRERAFCPFISDVCDGGGNRYMSALDLRDHPELKERFPGMERVPSGVCSIQVSDGQPPWIICHGDCCIWDARRAAKFSVERHRQSCLNIVGFQLGLRSAYGPRQK